MEALADDVPPGDERRRDEVGEHRAPRRREEQRLDRRREHQVRIEQDRADALADRRAAGLAHVQRRPPVRGERPAQQLGLQDVFPVCSPLLLDGRDALESPEQLNDFVLIHDDMQMSWESWARSAGCTQPMSNRGPKFSHSHMAMQAAVNGDGIVLGRSVLAVDHLDAGRLVRPVRLSVPAEHSYFLLCQEGMVGDPRVTAFTKWLLDEAKEFRKRSFHD
jgi:DNA-binding transcriptional LysR family regulator